MKARFAHFNFNVFDLRKSIVFYEEALGLSEVKRIERPGFTLVYMGDGVTGGRVQSSLQFCFTEGIAKPLGLL